MQVNIYQVKNLDKKSFSQSIFIFGIVFILFLTQLSNAPKGYADTSCSSGNFTETVTGNVHILTFLSNGSNDASCKFEVPENVYSLDYLIVAGGGGGNSGGGGAGGLVTSWEVTNQAGNSQIAARNNPLGVTPGDSLTIAVGVGGRGGSGGNYNVTTQNSFQLGTNGADSALGGITAKGGGRGGFGFGCEAGEDLSVCDQRGASGGSNGGAAYDNASVNNNLVSGTAYVGATSLGNIGGASVGSSGYRAGSGGGGAGAGGAGASVLHVGGAGGNGVLLDISGNSMIYACGGGGGINENDPSFATAYGWKNETTNEVVEDLRSLLSYDHFIVTYTNISDGSTWTYNYEQNSYTSPNNVTWTFDEVNHFYTNGVDNIPDIFSILDSESSRSIEFWINNFDNSTWTYYNYNDTFTSNIGHIWSYYSELNQPRQSFYSGVNGGGPGGCAGAGRGSNIGVYGPWGASPLSNATSGTNNFGHGGGGTDPESTVAGSGGSGVVIVRYVNQDANCPNDHNANGVSTPIACIAAVTISADGNSISTFVNGSPISYTSSANTPTVTILNSPTGLTSSVNSGNIIVSAPISSSLAGGTYPLTYRISEGGNTSDSVLLVTVIDPGQHSPVLVLVDPRATEVVLPEIVVGNINATLVCVTPRSGVSYPNNPVIDVTESVANISKTLYANSGGIRLIDNSNSNAPINNLAMQDQVKYIKISKSSLDQYLLPGDASRFIDINVSNTATGGNGSCRGGTISTVELRPLGIDQILRKGNVVLKN
jgi:hypothetical protein